MRRNADAASPFFNSALRQGGARMGSQPVVSAIPSISCSNPGETARWALKAPPPNLPCERMPQF